MDCIVCHVMSSWQQNTLEKNICPSIAAIVLGQKDMNAKMLNVQHATVIEKQLGHNSTNSSFIINVLIFTFVVHNAM